MTEVPGKDTVQVPGKDAVQVPGKDAVQVPGKDTVQVPGKDAVRRRIPSQDRKSCWVCFATEDDDPYAQWVRPCRCRGTTKWIHQCCLQRWVDEKQRGNSTAKVSCPQCNTEYAISFPELGTFVNILDVLDKIIYKICPFAAGGLVIGSIYWTAVTYGAVTVMQLLGHKEGLDVMERADPIFLLIGLPTIPVVLILGKMVRWEEYVLRLWRKYSSKLPYFNSLFSEMSAGQVPRVPMDTHSSTYPISATRILCGAMIFPTIATVCGKLMFSNINSNMQRTMLGGIAFVAIKGALKIFYQQQQYIRQAHRVIRDFIETDTEEISPVTPSSSAFAPPASPPEEIGL